MSASRGAGHAHRPRLAAQLEEDVVAGGCARPADVTTCAAMRGQTCRRPPARAAVQETCHDSRAPGSPPASVPVVADGRQRRAARRRRQRLPLAAVSPPARRIGALDHLQAVHGADDDERERRREDHDEQRGQHGVTVRRPPRRHEGPTVVSRDLRAVAEPTVAARSTRTARTAFQSVAVISRAVDQRPSARTYATANPETWSAMYVPDALRHTTPRAGSQTMRTASARDGDVVVHERE